MPDEKNPLWMKARHQSKVIPFLYTKKAKHRVVTELLETLKQALKGGA